MENIFSIENWWRWLIVVALLVGAFFLLRSLAIQLFGKPKLNDTELDENENYHNVSTASGYKRGDIANIDSGMNTSTAANVAIDAAIL